MTISKSKCFSYRFRRYLSLLLTGWCCLNFFYVQAQRDSVYYDGRQPVTLTPVVIRNNLNIENFIQHIKKDTSFYKAFKNLRVMNYTAQNSIFIFDKQEELSASLQSTTHQFFSKGCRWMKVLDEKTTGDFYDRHQQYNYYTASLYASLFFTKDTICGETNIIGDRPFEVRGKSGIDKHKEQLKLLFFNPGMPVSGVPFIGNKVAIFEDPMNSYYDFEIDMEIKNGTYCYVFKVNPRADISKSEYSRLVINRMITWFDPDSWQVLAREYDLSYKAGIYEFDVRMEAVLSVMQKTVVPTLLRYNGYWKVIGKKRENASFTATLYGFE